MSARRSRKPRAPDPDRPPLLMTLNEVAARCRVSRRTVERRIKDGTLRATKDMGGTRIVAASVFALLNQPAE
jgi:excisionase family DNA binding protein